MVGTTVRCWHLAVKPFYLLLSPSIFSFINILLIVTIIVVVVTPFKTRQDKRKGAIMQRRNAKKRQSSKDMPFVVKIAETLSKNEYLEYARR